MYGRIYKCQFESITVAAAQDLFQIKGATGKMCGIRRVSLGLGDVTLPSSQALVLRARFLPATVTDGNGTAHTPTKTDPGDAAASFTAIRNSTTPATSSNTAVILEEWGPHILSGHDFWFPKPPPIGPSESFVYELLNTPSGTVKLSCTVEVEEIGG